MTDGRAVRRSLRTDFSPSMKLRVIRAAFRARQAAHVPALLLGGRVERPIFIVGAPRSGTSLLYMVARASRRVAHWPGEAHEVWEARHHPALRGWGSNVLDASDLTSEDARRIRRAFFLTTGPRKRLIDKTPRNVLRVPFVEAVFPDALFVHLIRDGRDNVNSLINAWRTPRYRTYRLPEPHSIAGADPEWWKFVLYPGWREDAAGPLEVVCAKQWAVSNDHVLAARAASAPERWTALRYEDFVADPVAEIERLFSFLGLEPDDRVRARARTVATTPVNVVTPPERGKWRRENPRAIEAIAPLIRPTMDALGYAP